MAGFRQWVRLRLRPVEIALLTSLGLLGLGNLAPAQEEEIIRPLPPMPLTVPIQGAPLPEKFQFLTQMPYAGSLDTTFFQFIDNDSTVNSDEISNTGLTPPSLWWTRDQLPPRLGGFRLPQQWYAYRLKDSPIFIVDMFLDSQTWTGLTYTERYSVLNQFGTAAKTFGYNLRIYQGAGFGAQLAGVYVCDFENTPEELVNSEDDRSIQLTQLSCLASLDLQILEGFRSSDQ